MNLFERYLTLWVFLCIVLGIALGQFFPGVFQAIGAMEVAQVNLPVGLLIWVMVIPMLVKVDFGALHEVRQHVRGIGVTLFVNWLVKPFSMALLGWLFVRQLFAPWLPAEQLESYIAGLILLAAAPCTAMVFVWSRLSRGDPLFTLSQVALNDSIMVVAFAPLVGLLLGYLLALPFWLFEAIGFIVDNQRGANMAAMLNPLTGSESSPLGLLMNMAFITIYIALGGMQVLLGVVYDSYKLWDPLQFWPHFGEGFADLVFPQLNRMLAHCLLLAAPAMLVMLLSELSLALVSRFAPQLQVFFLAMPIKSALGIFILAISSGTLFEIARGQIEDSREWLHWLAPVLQGGA